MVGVPGRSKACITCKNRRRRCDALRPRCTPCRKSAIECGGYESSRVFVNSTQGTWPRGSAYTNPPLPDSSSRQPGSQPMVAPVSHSQSLARTAYQEQYLHLFLDAYLPRSHGHNLGDRRWTSVIRESCHDDEALTFALLANSLAAVGKRAGEGWMMRESFRIYGRSLGELTKALRMPTRTRKDDSLLSTARLLSTFELFVGSDVEGSITARSQNWERHVRGELALLQARGAKAFAYGDAHTMFADGRLNYYIMSAKQRTKLFVSELEWKTVPWMVTPKTSRDLLFDLLLDVPGVLEDYDRLLSCPDTTTEGEQRDALIAQCWELDKRLQSWATSSYSLGLTDMLTSAGASFALSSEELARIELETLYWSGCLLVYGTLQQTLGATGATGLPERADHTTYICNIARAMPFLLDPQSGMFGQQVAAWPLAMALQFSMISRELAEPPSENCAMLVGSLEGPGGEEISGFLLSMNADSDRHPAWMSEIAGPAGIQARARRWVGVGGLEVEGSWLGEDNADCDAHPEKRYCVVRRLLYPTSQG